MKKYILSLDQGTSSSRAIIFDKSGNIKGVSQAEFTQFYPDSNMVEQNPEEIFSTQYKVAHNVLKDTDIKPEQIAAIGITNQRETTIVWDKISGEPVYNAIVWQDKRTSKFCNELKKQGKTNIISEKTGLVIDSYFSATKIKWILDNVKEARKKAENGDLLFGTVDTWLIWKLTGGKHHVTDYTNASRTLLFNIKTLKWDKELLQIFNIPESILPKVVESSSIIGNTDITLFDGYKIPIAGIAGDQQAALFGQAGFGSGLAKSTYGTGCFILMNTGNKKVMSSHGLLTTLTCETKYNSPSYALEGSVFIAGAAIKWLRDALHLIKDAKETQQIAQNLKNTDGVYVVPAFSGLGAPYWDMYARGGIFGLTLGVTDKHIVKATLESLAYQTIDVIGAMEKDAKINIKELNVDGGASANNYLMQFQADLLNTKVIRPKIIETTALGAAFLAGLAVKYWKNTNEIEKIREIEKIFNPKMSIEQSRKFYKGWQNAVKKVMSKD
jgi:glycerol kinase